MATPKTPRSLSYVFKRYIWLISLLYDYKYLTYKEIADKWKRSLLNDEGKSFPLRTFRDHIRAVQEVFGVTISNTDSYKYHIEGIEDINSDTLRVWMLDNFSLSNALEDSRDIKDRIFLQDIPSSKKWLSTIIRSIRDKSVLLVEYSSYQKGKVPTLRLCPFFIKLYDNRWYLYARSIDNSKMKVYGLDRIVDILVSEEQFDFEPSDEEILSVKYSFGYMVYEDIRPCEIVIKAYGAASKYLDSLPLHSSQEKIEEGDGYAVYKYYFAPTSEFQAVLRKLGGQLEVIKM